MNNLKQETLLRAALDASVQELEQSEDLNTGVDRTTDIWELIIRYHGDINTLSLRYPAARFIELLGNYGILFAPRSLIDLISQEEMITYVEKPKCLYYEVLEGKRASCITTLQAAMPSLSGRQTLVAVIDSGIDYRHPDFRNSDGSTRILALWDQTIAPAAPYTAPLHYGIGTLYSREIINEALAAPTADAGLQICPSQDISGHGTHVAGIAAGNGRASDGGNRGVAYEADLLVVKLGSASPLGFPNTAQLMMAVDFCVRTALVNNVPMSINLSYGNTYGSHSGNSLPETYLDTVSTMGRLSVSVGSGNEGAGNGHAGGILENSLPYPIEFSVSDFSPTLNIQLWKNYWDDFMIALSPPAGTGITIPIIPGAGRFTLGNTKIYTYVGEPTPYSPFQEIYLDFLPSETYLTAGIWTIHLIPQRIRDGRWDMWLPVNATKNINTGFLRPNPETTLTIPSTASRVITVGAYDSSTNTPAPFSGRGYTRNQQLVKPDLVAPGVNILSCAPGGTYTVRSGTSMATPFVSGTAALLLQWGLVDGREPYLYGDKLKAYLINGTRPLPGYPKVPNPVTGWGSLCANASFPW